ncbi:hypothetical protein VTK73DRAFT_1973 [Phialemonium thermophilum]|uniref:Uncharacterized protein n=1 Tax=Phialemonium thermophilum TaxID=223376 RepID=A0ABR3VSQ4_9PEZI
MPPGLQCQVSVASVLDCATDARLPEAKFRGTSHTYAQHTHTPSSTSGDATLHSLKERDERSSTSWPPFPIPQLPQPPTPTRCRFFPLSHPGLARLLLVGVTRLVFWLLLPGSCLKRRRPSPSTRQNAVLVGHAHQGTPPTPSSAVDPGRSPRPGLSRHLLTWVAFRDVQFESKSSRAKGIAFHPKR